MVRHWLVVVLMTSFLTHAARQPCHTDNSHDVSRCTAADQQTTEYRQFGSLLEDGENTDNTAKLFLWYTVLETYKFLHPCIKRPEAVLMFFYDMKPPRPADAAWEAQMEQILINANPYNAIHRRRRRRRRSIHSFSNDASLIWAMVNNTAQATSANCLYKMILDHKDAAATSFRSSVPGFQIPPGSTPIFTTTTTTTTTTTRPTTTTTIPTTPRPTPTQSTTTTPPRTTPSPLLCSRCSEMECLLALDKEQTVKPCPSPDHLCYIEVDDHGYPHITRGCMLKADCQQINNKHCQNVETATKDDALHCKFCCDADRCNLPPHLLPVFGTVYPHPPP